MRDPAGVAVTRAVDDAAPLGRALADAGLHPVFTPLLDVELLDLDPLVERLSGPDPFDWLVCTSRRGVERIAAACARRGLDPRRIPATRVAAVGVGTAEAFTAMGLAVDMLPLEVFDAEHLARQLLADQKGRVGRILFPRALEARDVLPRMLRDAGWIVEDVACYEMKSFPSGGARLVDAIRAGEVTGVTLASGSAARAFAELIPSSLWSSVRLVSIGATTSAAARVAGLSVAGEAVSPSMDALAFATRRILLDTLAHA